ncbi:MAG TPA: hypothetical protein VMM84_08025 [Pyrinomonadaceae bacterium]|nr:hypothetical protein [Pyrinomonadaceae bacterium]
MRPLHLTALALVLLTVPLVELAHAQRPGPRPRRTVDFDFEEPRTRLEEFERRIETVLIRGWTTVGPIEGLSSIRIQALELRDVGNNSVALGVVITLRDTSVQPTLERRALVDYEDIAPLIKSLDLVARADSTITKHTRFEASYHTRGGLEVRVFRQTSGGIASAVSAGDFERLTIFLSLDELAKVRALILEARAKLDELK